MQRKVQFAEAEKNEDKSGEKATVVEEYQNKPKALNANKILSDGRALPEKLFMSIELKSQSQDFSIYLL